MMNRAASLLLIAGLLSCGSFRSAAATHYVNASNPKPVFPYTTWETAATNIQDAVDAADAGELVLVTNGVYETGGKAAHGSLTNRVAITNARTVQSVNGPEVTTIVGRQEPDTINGDGAMRCVYLADGALLSGFTLTNGATRNSVTGSQDECGGGVFCASDQATVTNCVLSGNSARVYGGGSYNGTLNNCVLRGNSSLDSGGGSYYSTLNNCTLSGNSSTYDGGGVYAGALNNCTLTGNSSLRGGGARTSTLYNCTLADNLAFASGGGSYYGTLNNCIVKSNSANSGGGVYVGKMTNCIVSGNSARGGGGVWSGTLNNCIVNDNTASSYGGGAYFSTLYNCTLCGNSASGSGGGADSGTLDNCIVYYNSASNGADYLHAVLNYCCTAPLPTSGTGNITNAPLFVNREGGDFHLQSGSPCINAGNNAYAPASADLDGNPRIAGGTVDMGAYESSALPPVPPEFISCLWLTNAVQLQFTGEIGKAFEVHGSTNLTDWVPLATLTNLSGQVLYTDPAVTNHPSRFYRAMQLP